MSNVQKICLETMLLDWSETAKGGAKIVLQLPSPDDLAPFRGMTLAKRGMAGQRLMAVFVEIGEDEQPVKRADASGGVPVPEKPFGKYAAELHRLGWWFNPKVLEAIGTDEEYRAWIQKQKCIACGGQDWVQEIGEGRCEAAHVKRPSNSGVGHKPEFSCAPLCHKHHVHTQHKHGLPTLYAEHLELTGCKDRQVNMPTFEAFAVEAREWFDKKRDRLLKEWASETLAARLGYDSIGYVPADELLAWAEKHGLADTLPKTYRNGRVGA